MILTRLKKWLGIADLEGRMTDVEKHFVTRRDEHGQPTETLADVPLAERKERKQNLAGMSWQQRKRWLEETDGGRNIPRTAN